MHDARRSRIRRGLAAGVMTLGVAAAGAGVHVASAAPAQDATGAVIETTMQVSGTFDGGGRRFVAGGSLGDGGQAEGQEPMFRLADGATLTNVTLGAPAADGVHCEGSCTLLDITWEDVGEDAATFTGSNATVLVDGGSAAHGTDKIFQDNRLDGGSVTIRNFAVSDFGKLYRSCGTCDEVARTASIENVTATAPGDTLAGVNSNMGDRVSVRNTTVTGSGADDVDTCQLFELTGGEPSRVATEPDGDTCTAEGITVR